MALIRKPIVSGDIYVFFQTTDAPTNPSYIRLDINTGMWSSPFTLPGMTLHGQEGGAYNSDPRAIYYNNQLYLFGRAPDNTINAMTSMDGEYWSAPIANIGPNYLTCSAVTPYSWGGALFILFPGTDNNIYSMQCGQDLNGTNLWSTGAVTSAQPLAAALNSGDTAVLNVLVNSNNRLWCTRFNFYGFSLGASNDGNPLLGGASALNCSFGLYLATADPNANLVMCQATQNDMGGTYFGQSAPIDNITMGSAPSALVLNDDGTTATIAVFYANSTSVDSSHGLNMAIIEINAGMPSTYRVVAIQEFGISMATASPFALAVP